MTPEDVLRDLENRQYGGPNDMGGPFKVELVQLEMTAKLLIEVRAMNHELSRIKNDGLKAWIQ